MLLGPAKFEVFKLQICLLLSSCNKVVIEWDKHVWEGFWMHYLWDYFHPIFYTWCVLQFISYFRQKYNFLNAGYWKATVLLAGLLDILENIAHMFIFWTHNRAPEVLLRFISMLSVLKWSIFIILITTLLLQLIFRRLSKSKWSG